MRVGCVGFTLSRQDHLVALAVPYRALCVLTANSPQRRIVLL